ncbi:thiamine pyrophosphate-dependent enzyme [Thauera phenolivorans]|nr:thiamine pyrophosphate-dependent enzyme [Thauera phenolivorans]
MSAVSTAPAPVRLFLSGNEAVALAVRDAGCRVAAAYPGTPSTEILEALAREPHPGLYTEWSVNEKVSLEVALGASMVGARAFCAMKHVGLNVAADALMTITVTGSEGGLVIAVADDVGMSSSQNEQDSRYWGRFAHLPLLEPADAQESYDMARAAFDLSERFSCPVIVRLTTRVCHVKGRVIPGTPERHEPRGFVKDPRRWVMVPGNAKPRVSSMYERDLALRAASEASPFNRMVEGSDRRIGFVTSGPAFMHVRESFPDAPVLKLGQSHPLPLAQARALAARVDQLLVVEETEPLLETELRAAGIACRGKDVLPPTGELSPDVLKPAVARLLGEPVTELPHAPLQLLFPRPPTMCVACPHLGIYYTLAQVRNVAISGDIGCYTLGAGQPWNALDSCISMGASMGVALGMDKGRGEIDAKRSVVAVIGDSTFMHMGMQGLLDITWNRGNVTILLLDNRTVGMTGGQENPGSGRDIHGEEAPRVDFAKLCEALGVRKERIRVLDPYQLPVLFKALREETKIPEPSVIITDRPCVLIDHYEATPPYRVIADKCTGCANCLDVGCPAIHVTRRDSVVKPSGKTVDLAFVRIETAACTGCGLCVQPCAPEAIVHAKPEHPVKFLHKQI